MHDGAAESLRECLSDGRGGLCEAPVCCEEDVGARERGGGGECAEEAGGCACALSDCMFFSFPCISSPVHEWGRC